MAARSKVSKENAKVLAAIHTAKLGVFDGGHHKDWVIQEMVRHLCGWDEGQLAAWLKRLQWERGIAP